MDDAREAASVLQLTVTGELLVPWKLATLFQPKNISWAGVLLTDNVEMVHPEYVLRPTLESQNCYNEIHATIR